MNATPSEEQRAHCRNCGNQIIWYFDRDGDANILPPYGNWYNVETMTEACGEIEDGWHQPDSEVWPAAFAHVASLANAPKFVGAFERVVNLDLDVYVNAKDARAILEAFANPLLLRSDDVDSEA